jgi:hypothetical protein
MSSDHGGHGDEPYVNSMCSDPGGHGDQPYARNMCSDAGLWVEVAREITYLRQNFKTIIYVEKSL